MPGFFLLTHTHTHVYVIKFKRNISHVLTRRSLSTDDENWPDQRLSVCNRVKGTESVIA